MKRKNGDDIADRIGKNVNSLLNQAGITIVGFSHATNISLNYARTIRRGKASITLKTAKKIACFFSIDVGLLFLDKEIKLTQPLKIPTIENFYIENSSNEKFFISRVEEHNLTKLLRQWIRHEKIFNDWIRSKDIVNFVTENKKYSIYKSLFNIKSVSKALSRIFVNTDLLIRRDLRNNGKVFQYKRSSN